MAEPIAAVDFTKLYVGSDARPFNFKPGGIDEAEGARLLAALPLEAQRAAKAKATAMENVKMPLIEELPPELRDPGKLEAFLSEWTKSGGKVLGDSSASFKAILQRMNSDDAGMDGVRALVDGYSDLQDMRRAAGFVGGVASEYVDMLRYPDRRVRQLWKSRTEASGAPTEKPSYERRVALTAVHEAVARRLVKTTDAPEVVSTEAPTFADEAVARVEQGWNWLSASGLGMAVRVVFKVIGNMVGGKGFDISQAMAEVGADMSTQGEPPSYDTLLDRHMQAKAKAKVGDTPAPIKLSDIEEVAGLQAKSFFRLMENGGYYASFDGTIHRLDKGGEKTTPVPFQGASLTLEALNKNRDDKVTGSIGTHGATTTTIAATGAAITGAGAAATVVARQMVKPAVTAAAEHAAALKAVEGLAQRLARAEAGHGRYMDAMKPEAVGPLREQLAAAQAKVDVAQGKLDRLGVSPAPEVDGKPMARGERAAHATQERVAAMKAQGGAPKAAAHLVDFAEKSRAWWNPVRWASAIGSGIGAVADTVVVKPVVSAFTYGSEVVVGARNKAVALGEVVKDLKWGAEHLADAKAAVAAEKAATAANSAQQAATAASRAAAYTPKWVSRLGNKGAWGAAIAGLFGAGFSGYAAAKEDGATVGSVTQAMADGGATNVAKVTGVSETVDGDYTRGAASLATFFSSGLAPITGVVDVVRRNAAMKAVDAAQVAALNTAIPADVAATGNEYLDRVIKLKDMQRRRVKEVALHEDFIHPFNTELKRGKIAHEGAVTDREITQFFTASVTDAIEMNLRLYVVNGGDLAKAQALFAAKGQHTPEAGILAVAADATMRARAAADKATSVATGEKKLAFATVKSVDGLDAQGMPQGSRAMVPQPALVS